MISRRSFIASLGAIALAMRMNLRPLDVELPQVQRPNSEFAAFCDRLLTDIVRQTGLPADMVFDLSGDALRASAAPSRSRLQFRPVEW